MLVGELLKVQGEHKRSSGWTFAPGDYSRHQRVPHTDVKSSPRESPHVA